MQLGFVDAEEFDRAVDPMKIIGGDEKSEGSHCA
jgi:hypothetical protein